MPPKKELCRNFQRGSCQYGDRCKFLHANQQQSKPNPFGFGSQSGSQFQRSSQPQQNNPFGFGQTASQPRGNDFGSKNNQFKPFENKWSKDSGSTPAAQKPDNKSSAPTHKCTDPEECKRLIAEDFKNERPLWLLTCYGHSKNGPCDIVGDISYEELRYAAFVDEKQGLSLQSIVERERNLLKAKMQEFDSLLRNPFSISPNSTLASQNPFSGNTPVAPMTNAAPPTVSSFSQLGTSLNTGFGMRPITPNNAFGNAGSFGSQPPVQPFGSQTPAQPFGSQTPAMPFGSQTPAQPFGSQPPAQPFGSQPPAQPFGSQPPAQPFGSQPPAQPFGSQPPAQPFGSQPPAQPFGSQPPAQPFGSQPPAQPFGSQTPAQPFGSQTLAQPFGSQPPAQPFGSQPPAQPFGSSMGPTSNFGNTGPFGSQLPNQPFGSSVSPSTSIFGTKSAMPFSAPNSATNGFPQVSLHATDNMPKGNRDNIDSIWLKEEWNPGEIPEEAPPDEAIW